MDEQPTEDLGYQEAVDELDRILSALERDDVDVDALAAEVSRAAELIAVCRVRIERARMQVEEIVSDLNTEDGSGTGDE